MQPSQLDKLKEIDFDSDESLPSTESEPEEDEEDKLDLNSPKVDILIWV